MTVDAEYERIAAGLTAAGYPTDASDVRQLIDRLTPAPPHKDVHAALARLATEAAAGARALDELLDTIHRPVGNRKQRRAAASRARRRGR
jgi:hypothetical protein